MNERSEGEVLIEEYLEEKNIDYDPEVEIHNLKDDEAKFRVADFYLPQYKVYMEFFGRWNVSEKAKNKYREKIRVYKENKIPCIYLYPDNLGILDFIFPKRLRQTLKIHKLKSQLFKYNLGEFFKLSTTNIVIVTVALILFKEDKTARIIFILLLLFVIGVGIKETFLKGIKWKKKNKKRIKHYL